MINSLLLIGILCCHILPVVFGIFCILLILFCIGFLLIIKFGDDKPESYVPKFDIIETDNYKIFTLDSKIHRTDGPAMQHETNSTLDRYF